MSITSLKRNSFIGRNSLTSLDTQADQPTLGLCTESESECIEGKVSAFYKI